MVENTSRRDPRIHLLGAQAEGLDGYIAGMEAAGMRQLLASDLLPARMIPGDEGVWTALGFVFGGVVADDPLFRRVTLPAGWTRAAGGPGDDPRGGYVVDECGVRRVSIFYKAAFYDRAASMVLLADATE